MRTVKLKARFSDRLILPDEAVSADPGAVYETLDGRLCSMRFLSTRVNKGDCYADELDLLCGRFIGAAFSAVRSIWIGRLGTVGDVWHFVRLDELE